MLYVEHVKHIWQMRLTWQSGTTRTQKQQIQHFRGSDLLIWLKVFTLVFLFLTVDPKYSQSCASFKPHASTCGLSCLSYFPPCRAFLRFSRFFRTCSLLSWHIGVWPHPSACPSQQRIRRGPRADRWWTPTPTLISSLLLHSSHVRHLPFSQTFLPLQTSDNRKADTSNLTAIVLPGQQQEQQKSNG